MSEREFRDEAVGEHESGELPSHQEENEGLGGGSASGDDYAGAGDDGPGDDALSLDSLPDPDGEPVDLDELRTAQEEADALALADVREELAELAAPEGEPEETADPDGEDRDDDDTEEDEEGEGDGGEDDSGEDDSDYEDDDFDDDYGDDMDDTDDVDDGYEGDGGD